MYHDISCLVVQEVRVKVQENEVVPVIMKRNESIKANCGPSQSHRVEGVKSREKYGDISKWRWKVEDAKEGKRDDEQICVNVYVRA